MRCQKCGVENPGGIQKCSSCGSLLADSSVAGMAVIPVRSKVAVASFVLGILSLIFLIVTGIPAIVLGIIALVKIVNSRGQLRGMGLAITGIAIPVVWSPIVMLLAILLPAFSMVSVHAQDVKQKAQLHTLEIGLEIFKNDFGDYPPSGALDDLNQPYCGAQKLTEALLGLDLMGFHPNSVFRGDGTDKFGKSIYVESTVGSRRGPYLQIENNNSYRLRDIFEDVGSFDGNNFVICDVFVKKRHSGKKTGMPILYYKANISSKTMDAGEPMDKRIYNAEDNLSLIRIAGAKNGKLQPLAGDNGSFFYSSAYKIIKSKVTTQAMSYRGDSFILISAGPDGLYGTADDILNLRE